MKIALGLTLLLCSALSLAAAEPQSLDLKTQRVIIFKDGHCLFHKHGAAVTDKQRECFTDDVPDAAVLGSFWALPKEGRLVSMRAGWETVTTSTTKEVPCTGYLDVLLANQGERVRIEMNDKEAVTGTIHRVITQPASEALTPTLAEIFGIPPERVPGTAAHTLAMSLPHVDPRLKQLAEGATQYVVSGVSGTQLILRTDEGDALINVGNIKSLRIQNMKNALPRTLTTRERTKRLTFRLDQAEKPCDLDLLYFRPGMRWIPTYRVSLSEDPKKKVASLALQAEILNEAEPLVEVPLDIVVGVPNFRFRQLPSPLTLETVLRNALQVAEPQLMGNFRNDL
ncbi:MAG TPA: hypothetical protein VL096_05675, partial [Pirellulaceae bacterium]|nr:hypothetical protein [Pirellulaceae bacterium]